MGSPEYPLLFPGLIGAQLSVGRSIVQNFTMIATTIVVLSTINYLSFVQMKGGGVGLITTRDEMGRRSLPEPQPPPISPTPGGKVTYYNRTSFTGNQTVDRW